MSNDDHPGLLRIGDWIVSPSELRISDETIVHSIEAKVMDVLLMLADQAGRVVSREELLDAIWGTGIGSDQSLTNAISQLRKSFGDRRESRQHIRTIPKKGYQLIAPVKRVKTSYSPSDKKGLESLPNSIEGTLLDQVEEHLTLMLFQFFETKHLSDANDKIASQTGNKQNVNALIRLSLISKILEFSLVTPDKIGERFTLLERFEKKLPNDPWLPVLKATVSYSSAQYGKATEQLNREFLGDCWPGAVAANFFKAVCLLKEAQRTSEPIASNLLKRSTEVLKDVERLAHDDADLPIKHYAVASSVIFQAIQKFSARDIGGAEKLFLTASQFSEGSLRARAFSGAGFCQFILGQFEQAEMSLLEALEYDAEYPVVRINYGYLLLSRNQFQEAISLYNRVIEESKAQNANASAVILAKFAIGHAKEEMQSNEIDTSEYYSQVLAAAGLRSFYEIHPLNLRLAYQYFEIASKVYTSNDYYGMEIFALVMLGKARAKLGSLLMSDARAQRLRLKIDDALLKLNPKVPTEWTNGRYERGSFFGWAIKTEGSYGGSDI